MGSREWQPATQPAATSRRQPATVVVQDAEPLPQQIVPETRVVEVQGNAYARAHQWASEQVLRRYPQATDCLQLLESLIKQHMNAD